MFAAVTEFEQIISEVEAHQNSQIMQLEKTLILI